MAFLRFYKLFLSSYLQAIPPHRYGKLASFLHQESSYEPLLKTPGTHLALIIMLSTLYVPKTNNNYSMPGSMQPQKDNPFLFWVKEVMYFFWKTIAAR